MVEERKEEWGLGGAGEISCRGGNEGREALAGTAKAEGCASPAAGNVRSC